MSSAFSKTQINCHALRVALAPNCSVCVRKFPKFSWFLQIMRLLFLNRFLHRSPQVKIQHSQIGWLGWPNAGTIYSLLEEVNPGFQRDCTTHTFFDGLELFSINFAATSGGNFDSRHNLRAKLRQRRIFYLKHYRQQEII